MMSSRFRVQLFSISIVLLFPAVLTAQSSWQASFDPGYYLVNSDRVFASGEQTKLAWSWGGKVGHRFQVDGKQVLISLGYSGGQTEVMKIPLIDGPDLISREVIKLRQHLVPVELFWIHEIKGGIEVATGINLVGMHRIINAQFDIENGQISPASDDDRLFSLGAGLSGRIRADVARFGTSNEDRLFVTLSARWTEFLYNQARGRNLDDFYVRHLIVNPGVGINLAL